VHYTQGVKCATSALKLATGTPNATGETRKQDGRENHAKHEPKYEV
jgi:hypothetical protein